MHHNNGENLFDSKEMEVWLNQFFLDPMTSYLDDTIFRIDLYDSDNEFIIEALLPNIQKDDIDVTVSKNELQINVKEKDKKNPQRFKINNRTVTFPIPISQLPMEVSYKQDILEIKLLKDG